MSKLFIDANSVPGWLWVSFFSLCKFMRVSGLRRQLEVIFKVFYSNSWEQWCNVTHEWLIQQPTRLWFLTETNGASSSIIKNKCCCWTDTVSLSNSSHTDSRYTFTYQTLNKGESLIVHLLQISLMKFIHHNDRWQLNNVLCGAGGRFLKSEE